MCGMPGRRDPSKQSNGIGSSIGEGSLIPIIDLSGNGAPPQKGRYGTSISNTGKRKAPGTTNSNVDSATSTASDFAAKKPFQNAGTRHLHSFSLKVLPKRSEVEAESEADRILKTVFQLKCLRNLQPQAVKCALQLKSQMIVMATGGGK
jgi:hypothetical protein